MNPSVKTVQLHISGMTCVNCQAKIEKALSSTEGIVSASVSYNKRTADIAYDSNQLSRKDIIAVIHRLGYHVLPDNCRQEPDWFRILAILMIIIALYSRLQALGILNLLVPDQLADSTMGYGMLFLIGLITSVHCIAMCGGINLSQCIPRTGQPDGEAAGTWPALRPALAYNLGRVLSYTAVGFLFGSIGFLFGGSADLGLSSVLQGVLKILAGLFMVIMGINMLELFPWLCRFTIRVPGFLARRIRKQRAGCSRPFLVGILNGFMPCGPLQSWWLVALAAGNPLSGALSMLLFSLGTLPLMLGLGSIVSVLGKRYTRQVMTIGAVLVAVLGLAMISQGGSLTGWLSPELLLHLVIAFSIAGVLLCIPVSRPSGRHLQRAAAILVIIGFGASWRILDAANQAASVSDTERQVVDGTQVVSSTLTPGRYPNITVQAGVPVRWVIDAPQGSINGCNYKLRIPDYGIEYTFHTGENVIEFTPEGAGTIRYSCWMGMIRGSIFVMDETDPEAAAADSGVPLPTPSGYTIPTDRIAVASLNAEEGEVPFQEVGIELTDTGFSPAVIVVQNNLAAIWNIENTMTEADGEVQLLAPFYSTKLLLQEGGNQLSLFPTDSFEVSTGDHRFYCYIKVVDDIHSVDMDAVRKEAAAFTAFIYPDEIFESPGMSCCGS